MTTAASPAPSALKASRILRVTVAGGVWAATTIDLSTSRANASTSRPGATARAASASKPPTKTDRLLTPAARLGRAARSSTRPLPHRPVAGRREPRAAAQHAQPRFEPGEDLVRRHDADPRRRELDRQRQPVEPLAQRGDRRFHLGVGDELGRARVPAQRTAAAHPRPRASPAARRSRRSPPGIRGSWPGSAGGRTTGATTRPARRTRRPPARSCRSPAGGPGRRGSVVATRSAPRHCGRRRRACGQPRRPGRGPRRSPSDPRATLRPPSGRSVGARPRWRDASFRSRPDRSA